MTNQTKHTKELRKEFEEMLEPHLTAPKMKIVFGEWFEKTLTSREEEIVDRLEIAIEAWMETHEEKQRTFQTKDFIRFLRKELNEK